MSEIGFRVFDIGINILESFLHVWFVTRYLGFRSEIRNTKAVFMIAFMVMLVWSWIRNILFVRFEGVFVMVVPLLLFFYALYALDGKKTEKIFVSIIPMLTTGLINSCVAAMQNIIFHIRVPELTMSRSYTYVFLIILTKVLFIVVALGILKLKKRLKGLPENRLWVLFIIILLTSLMSVFCLYMLIENEYIAMQAVWYLIAAIAGIILMDIVTFYFLKRIGKETELQQAIELLKQNTFYQQENVKAILQEQERTRQMHHDVKNVMLAMSGLIQEGKNEEAMSYCRQYAEDTASHGSISRTGLHSVDNLIVYKLNQAADYGLETRSRTSAITHTDVDELQLCVILGNLLDNAIEALRQQKAARQLEVTVEQNGDYVCMVIKNSIEDSVLAHNPELLTTKEDKSLHGFGLRNVRGLVKQYGGMISFEEDEGMFLCHIEI